MNIENLIQIAKEAIALNCNAALTGSLMCHMRGIKTRREPHDIDIVMYIDPELRCKAPLGFWEYESIGNSSDPQAISFQNSEGIKIDFLHSEENDFEKINGVMCANFDRMFFVKQQYAQTDRNDESRQKHNKDVEFIFDLEATKYNPDLKEGDKCPKCHKGIVEISEADDINDEFPNSGIYYDYLWCGVCYFRNLKD